MISPEEQLVRDVVFLVKRLSRAGDRLCRSTGRKTSRQAVKLDPKLISGRLRVRMDDGNEEEFGPGDFGIVPPGHDAWVVGDEPVVAIDITGMAEYSKPA